MLEIIRTVLASVGKRLPELILKTLGCVQTVFGYLNAKMDDKKKKEEDKIKSDRRNEIDEIVDGGSLQELLTKVSAVLVLSISIVGCVSGNDIQILTTNCWEGHYMSVSEFREKTKNISLSKGQSIWVISNDTLKRILRESEK